jgi:hypothetical protein
MRLGVDDLIHGVSLGLLALTGCRAGQGGHQPRGRGEAGGLGVLALVRDGHGREDEAVGREEATKLVFAARHRDALVMGGRGIAHQENGIGKTIPVAAPLRWGRT